MQTEGVLRAWKLIEWFSTYNWSNTRMDAFVQSNKTRHKIMEKMKMNKKMKKKIYETIPMENHEWIMDFGLLHLMKQ